VQLGSNLEQAVVRVTFVKLGRDEDLELNKEMPIYLGTYATGYGYP